MSLPDKAPEKNYEGWTILELMGHRRLGGYVRETEIAGYGFLRIDITGEGEIVEATQFYAPTAVYAITPTTEAMARAVALRNKPQPVQRWELPAPDNTEKSANDIDRESRNDWYREEEEI